MPGEESIGPAPSEVDHEQQPVELMDMESDYHTIQVKHYA